MNPLSLLIVYCAFIFVASNAGGRLSEMIRMTHLRTQLLMSGVGGLMLGISLLHLLPHAGEILGSYTKLGTGTLIGLVTMFLLIRVFHTHDHGGPVARMAVDQLSEPTVGVAKLEHDHSDCQHNHEHDSQPKRLGWAGVFFGLVLHTLIDGVALASSVIADAHHGAWMNLAGIGTFLAIALHIPLDSFTITSVMNKQGWSSVAQRTASMLFSLACPIGAFLFYLGAQTILQGTEILGWGLAVSAGFFICIALADLLPEVAFHDHDRGKLTGALFLGILLAVAIENMPGHNHSRDGDHPADHDHHF